MGICVSWIAVEGDDFPAVLKALELEDTREADADFSAEFSGAALAGWIIVVASKHEWATSRLSSLSHIGKTLGGFVEEHVMVSSLRAFERGEEKWSVLHNGGEKGPDDLTISGAPPTELNAIVAKLRKRQADDSSDDVDYLFDAPIELGEAICGFRHDQDPPASFTILEPIYPKNWLARLFFRYR